MDDYAPVLLKLLEQKEAQIKIIKSRIVNYSNKIKEEERLRNCIDKHESQMRDVYGDGNGDDLLNDDMGD